MHVLQICDRIVKEREHALALRVSKPPRHLHREESAPTEESDEPRQETLFEE